jgi:hypothetical protein
MGAHAALNIGLYVRAAIAYGRTAKLNIDRSAALNAIGLEGPNTQAGPSRDVAFFQKVVR